MTPQTT